MILAAAAIIRFKRINGCEGIMGWVIDRSVTRRRAAGALAAIAIALSAGLAVAADAIEQPAVEILAVRDPQLGAQVAIADTYGYFKDEGLSMTVHWTQSGADVLTLMGGGSQYLGTGGTYGAVALAAQGMPVKVISALADISATQGFALSPGVKLASPRELEGKKLAFTEGNSQIVLLAKMAKMYDFDMKKVTLVNMNPSEGVVAASKGDVAGLLGWQPNLYRLTTMGGTLYASGTELYVDGTAKKLSFDDRLQFNHSFLLAAQSWIDQKPNTMRAVLRALQKATLLLATDRPKALAAMEQKLKVDSDALKVMADANDYGLALTDSTAVSIGFTSDWALGIKRIPKGVTGDDCFAPALLGSIDAKLVSWKPKSS